MRFDYGKLRGKIREVYQTERCFAKALGIGRVSFSKRLNNRLDFSRIEMLRACDLLGIGQAEVGSYFFAPEVQKHEQTACGRRRLV